MTKPKGAGMVLIGIGTNLVAMALTGFVLGYGLDTWLGTRPLLMLVLGGLGFVGGIIRAHELLSRWLD